MNYPFTPTSLTTEAHVLTWERSNHTEELEVKASVTRLHALFRKLQVDWERSSA